VLEAEPSSVLPVAEVGEGSVLVTESDHESEGGAVVTVVNVEKTETLGSALGEGEESEEEGV